MNQNDRKLTVHQRAIIRREVEAFEAIRSITDASEGRSELRAAEESSA